MIAPSSDPIRPAPSNAPGPQRRALAASLLVLVTVLSTVPVAIRAVRAASGDEDASAAQAWSGPIALRATYASTADLEADLEQHSSAWPVHPYRYGGRSVLFYSTLFRPDPLAVSFVLAVEDTETKAVEVLDQGFFWRTAKNTSLSNVRYDHARRVVYYVDDYERLLGGRELDLGVTAEGAKRPIPEPRREAP